MTTNDPAGPMSLAGRWRYRLDPDDEGLAAGWFRANLGDETLTLPGTLTTNGVGERVGPATEWTGNMSVPETYLDPKWTRLSGERHKPPYWLSPETFYSGVAWYQRAFETPPEWSGSQVELELERPHWETTVWIDGVRLGSSRALSTPHRYLLPRDLVCGSHTVTIRIDNRYLVKIGAQAHSITDNTSGNWNGVVGTISLRARPRVRVTHAVVTPRDDGETVGVDVTLTNDTGVEWVGALTAAAVGFNTSRPHATRAERVPVTLVPGESRLTLDLDAGPRVCRWSEWDPALYELRLSLVSGAAGGGDAAGRIVDEHTATFGVRTLSVEGTGFRINGRPFFLRGTLECNIFPREGHTSTDEAAWEYILTRAREYGFNHLRFHSWCPPRAAFHVADRMGFYLQVESCCWAAHETKIGDGLPVDRFVYDESERIVAEYGNHPSFCFLNYGNEGDGERNAAFLTAFVEHWKTKDRRRLYTSASGWPQSPASDYHSALRARAQRYGEDGVSRYHINENAPSTDFDFSEDVGAFDRPLVSHEPGMWCVYPNFDETDKYTGAYKARNFELFRDELAEHEMLDQWRDFLMASGRLQTICYKAEIEAMLRTPGLAGFQLLSLMDFPGQGTAIMAPVDVFYEEKGYTDAAEWRRFLGDTVVLARIPSLVLSPDETLVARLETFHFGARTLRSRRMVWTIRDAAGTILRSGTLGPRDVPVGHGVRFAELRVALRDVPAPGRYTLQVTLAGTTATNSWELFLFPAELPEPDASGLHLTATFDSAARDVLRGGGTVVLNTFRALPEARRVVAGFTPVYWNLLSFPGQPIKTLGMLCNPRHPVFSRFPTQFHTNYQWWDMLTRAEACILDGAPPELRPLVQMIDSYHLNRRLGLVAEMRVLGGKLVINGIDLEHDLERRPAARQFRASLYDYLHDPRFCPGVDVDPDFVEQLYDADR